MIKKNRQGSLKAILLITALALLFSLPLKAEDKDYRGDQILIKGIKSKNHMNDFSFMSLGLKSNENTEPLHSLIKGYKSYSTILSFSRSMDESYATLKKDSHMLTTSKPIENSLFTTSLVTLVALNAGDFFSTNTALKYKDLKEANPLLSPLTKNTFVFAAVKFGVTAIDYYLLKKLYKKNKKLAWAVSIALNIGMSYVVINNIRWIKYAQKNSY